MYNAADLERLADASSVSLGSHEGVQRLALRKAMGKEMGRFYSAKNIAIALVDSPPTKLSRQTAVES